MACPLMRGCTECYTPSERSERPERRTIRTDLCPGAERCFHPFGCKRKLSQTGAGRVEDRVSDCRSGHGDRCFTGTHGGDVGPIDENRLDDGHLLTHEPGTIGAPVDGCHLVSAPRDFFAERPAHAENEA